jgi:hypothetical protein
MITPTIADARSFVRTVELPPPNPDILGETSPGEQSPFDAAHQQAAVVGSDVLSFVKETTPEQRKDIVNASLLAQLVADKKVPAPEHLDDILAWYRHYFDVLSHVGFVVQDKGFARYVEKADAFEAHEAILNVVKTALAGVPAALPLVIKTLESLKSMSDDTPWITLFHRESRSANTARFQVSLADTGPGGSFLNLFAFGLVAKATVTQVLFFRFRKSESELQHNSSKLTINDAVLTSVRDDIAQRIAQFTKDFVAGLDV